MTALSHRGIFHFTNFLRETVGAEAPYFWNVALVQSA